MSRKKKEIPAMGHYELLGWAAYLESKYFISLCPYQADTEAARLWEQGYQYAQDYYGSK